MIDSQQLIQVESRDGARVAIHPHGAHVVGWWPVGCTSNRLFLSSLAEAGPGKAIRGGVPVIFPQFADFGPMPKHGFARSVRWRLANRSQMPDGSASATFALTPDLATHALWPHDYFAALHVAVRDATLSVTLSVANMGREPLSFTAALHTYFATSTIADATIAGLEACAYRDSAADGSRVAPSDSPVQFGSEIDRVYLATPDRLELTGGDARVSIESSGFADTVVWNPGGHKAAQLKDLGAGEWQRFVCVEAARVAVPVVLAAGAVWAGSQIATAG